MAAELNIATRARMPGYAATAWGHRRTLLGAFVGILLALGSWPGEGLARLTPGTTLRLSDRSISVTATNVLASHSPEGRVYIRVSVRNLRDRPVTIAASDFTLSVDGDMFGIRAWSGRRASATIAPGRSGVFQLSFALPRTAETRSALFYRPAHSPEFGSIALNQPPSFGSSATSSSTAQRPIIDTFWLTQGIGDPWGTAIDASGNIWFAEPGCDFAPSCSPGTPPGQIGELNASTGVITYYTLPNIAGNQPIFLAFDGSGNLWFTTPNNSMIGEFNPSSGAFVGQWPVTAGSGPWDLVFDGEKIWYTEHFVSAVGTFDPSTHTFQDFQTPTPNSLPYGIAANEQQVWFTENNSSVDRVAVLNSTNDVISEYPIMQPLGNSTPHLISIASNGDPWWTEGWSNTIATLNPAAATPGTCGTTSGVCDGITRFQLPTSLVCSSSSHVSGIAYQSSTGLVWMDNSLTGQVGSFNPMTDAFDMSSVGCHHPHDGLILDPAGNVWCDEEFANALGELIFSASGASQPLASIAISPNPPISGSQATFTARVADPSGVSSVHWNFGDGSETTGNPVTHTYMKSGAMTLTAVIRTKDGNKDRVTERISVAPS
jgi:streptogramin lyase